MDVDKLKSEYEKVKEENTKLKFDVESMKAQVFISKPTNNLDPANADRERATAVIIL